jgi:DNA ligase-1
MSNREFLMLAKTFDPGKHRIGGWLVSEKFDGQRAFWDGGCTRGLPKTDVPWANTDKDGRYKEEQISTGLWSRYGNVIHAPDWWLDKMPKNKMLDGELYMGRGAFQDTRKIVSRLEGSDAWEDIRYMIIDEPPLTCMFQDGKINNPNYKKLMKWEDCVAMLKWQDFIIPEFFEVHGKGDYGQTWIDQQALPTKEDEARERMYALLDNVVSNGGEGLILRNPFSIWTPKRSVDLLKVKPCHDSEAVVKGYVWGTKRLLGKLGAMVVTWEGKTFELGTGFTDEERMLHRGDIAPEAWGNIEDYSGDVAADGFKSYDFPVGSTVTFKYVSLTDDGIPREARYWRKK